MKIHRLNDKKVKRLGWAMVLLGVLLIGIFFIIKGQNYRNVLKNWDTQIIGTSLKIVKIIILADPKYWTILRKRKNIRNFSDPKNWDSVFVAPK